MVSRFAPSPTGRLHLGHALSARLAWEAARQVGGQFLLRFEDIDHTRVRPEFYAAIEEDLLWLGLDWDGEPLRQLDRLEAYQNGLEELKRLGVLYPCFCTRRELALTAPQEGDEVAVYQGRCRNLTLLEREESMAKGGSYCWRLASGKAFELTGALDFTDKDRGRISVDARLLGDVVLARKDIATSYHLAVVLDDAFQGVTQVVRGEDLLESTHVHRILQKLLGLPEVVYEHHRLVADEQGKRLAKRHDALALSKLREEGVTQGEVWALAGLSPLNGA